MPDNNQKRPVGQTKFGKIVAAGSALLATTASQAAITAPDFTTNMTDLGVLLVAGVGFGAFVWGARKLLGFMS